MRSSRTGRSLASSTVRSTYRGVQDRWFGIRVRGFSFDGGAIAVNESLNKSHICEDLPSFAKTHREWESGTRVQQNGWLALVLADDGDGRLGNGGTSRGIIFGNIGTCYVRHEKKIAPYRAQTCNLLVRTEMLYSD